MGLISLQVGLLAKFALSSCIVQNASLLAMVTTLLLMYSFVVMFLLPLWMACVAVHCAFCHVLF